MNIGLLASHFFRLGRQNSLNIVSFSLRLRLCIEMNSTRGIKNKVSQINL